MKYVFNLQQIFSIKRTVIKQTQLFKKTKSKNFSFESVKYKVQHETWSNHLEYQIVWGYLIKTFRFLDSKNIAKGKFHWKIGFVFSFTIF